MILLLAAAAVAAPPLEMTTRVAVDPPASAKARPARAGRAAPGDRLTVTLGYRNRGRVPIGDLLLADPLPRGMTYAGAAPGSPEPELSVDGRRFAPIAALAVPLPAGGTRPAVPADVVAVRWRMAAPLAPGAGGELSFRAVLR